MLNNISAVAQLGSHLWLASDEGDTIERLSWNGTAFSDAASFRLDRYFALPPKPKEVDVEAVAIAGNELWIAGSHSMIRKSAGKERLEFDDNHTDQDPLARLAKIQRRDRRYLLGKVPLGNDGRDIARRADRAAPCIPFRDTGSDLTELLKGDAHLGPFLGLPDKENGLDIEGLAASGGRIWLGLRGPTVRGFAIILELMQVEHGAELGLRKIGPTGARYRKHFLDLAGLGIRDLAAAGRDLVILAGPTMGLSGPWAVLRWRDGLTDIAEGIVDQGGLEAVLPINPTNGDHPEGIVKFRHPNDGRNGWLVVYDHPNPARLSPEGGYQADFFF